MTEPGPAWTLQARRQRDAVLQPPKPDTIPASRSSNGHPAAKQASRRTLVKRRSEMGIVITDCDSKRDRHRVISAIRGGHGTA
jgi:hypothetical protein